MFDRRVLVLTATMASAASLQGCYISDDHPAFGAEDMKRVADFGGRPTYSMEGSTYYGLDASREASKVMLAACPDGNPTLLGGDAYSVKGQDRYGAPTSGTFWYATFSCDHPIKLD